MNICLQRLRFNTEPYMLGAHPLVIYKVDFYLSVKILITIEPIKFFHYSFIAPMIVPDYLILNILWPIKRYFIQCFMRIL